MPVNQQVSKVSVAQADVGQHQRKQDPPLATAWMSTENIPLRETADTGREALYINVDGSTVHNTYVRTNLGVQQPRNK